VELSAINKRLDRLTNLLTSSHHSHAGNNDFTDREAAQSEFRDQDDSPFKLLGTSSMMKVLGLGADFAEELISLERSALSTSNGNSSRLFIVQHQQAIR
jgi:hypothetical protein